LYGGREEKNTRRNHNNTTLKKERTQTNNGLQPLSVRLDEAGSLLALNTKGKMRLSILQKTAEEFEGKSKEEKHHPIKAKLQSVFDSPSPRKTLESTDRHSKEATKSSKNTQGS
jgi:hypothetical protein